MRALVILQIAVYAITVREVRNVHEDVGTNSTSASPEVPPPICCDGFEKDASLATTLQTCISNMVKAKPPADRNELVTAAESAGCTDKASQFIGTLVQGIAGAAAVEVTYDSAADAVTVAISTDGKLYGEISTRSRLPLEWVVDNTLVFKNFLKSGSGITLEVEGLHYWPAKEGGAMVQQYLGRMDQGTGCTLEKLQANPGVFDECVANEMKAIYHDQGETKYWKFYSKIFFNNGYKGKTGALLTEIPNEKLWTVIPTKDAAKIAYALATMAPKTVDRLVFNDAGIAAQTSLYQGDGFYDAVYTKEMYELCGYRASSMGLYSLVDAANSHYGIGDGLSLATMKAPSGMNFAKMTVWGDSLADGKLGPTVRKALKDAGITQTKHKMGDHAKMLNLVCACGELSDGDPQCNGDMAGRVGWSTTQSTRFTVTQ